MSVTHLIHTAKRQMNNYVNRGHDITTAEQMNMALQSATALCGFNSNVIDIENIKYTGKKTIKYITNYHCFLYKEVDGKIMCRVCRYYQIGVGKLFELPAVPSLPPYKVMIPFKEGVTSFGHGKRITPVIETFYCTDEMCLKVLKYFEELQYHLDFEEH